MIIEHLRASREAACIFDEQIISLSLSNIHNGSLREKPDSFHGTSDRRNKMSDARYRTHFFLYME